MPRIAFVNTHPVPYYAPLHRALAARPGWRVRVFFTWHDGAHAMPDAGFHRPVAWDVALTDGYESELVPNVVSRDPGPHRRGGLRNPTLLRRVRAWRPDAVIVTGNAYPSHRALLRRLPAAGIPVLFRGDSHLLDRADDRWWWLKRLGLRWTYRRVALALYVGSHNRRYFAACGVPPERLASCPHSIDTARFREPEPALSDEARAWRRSLGITDDQLVLLFAGKFEPKKAPLELMEAVTRLPTGQVVLLLVGSGELEGHVAHRAARDPARYRVVPFQNQSRMPAVYRLGDAFVLPSLRDETWGLAVNEALASGRPAIVSDRVGCAPDLIEEGVNGHTFPAGQWSRLLELLAPAARNRHRLAPLGRTARERATGFDTSVTLQALLAALERIGVRD
jgi:glycosyltransferase involved in cell wall biosynthesis